MSFIDVFPSFTDESKAKLQRRIHATLLSGPLAQEAVINACNRLSVRLTQGEFDEYIENADADPLFYAQLQEAKTLLGRPYLEEKLKRELRYPLYEKQAYSPPGYEGTVFEQTLPLGVILHIPASNAHGLSAVGVIEALLCGNINLVKLSSEGDSLSVLLLEELVKTEPALKEYIYLFPIPSSNEQAVSRMMSLADGIAVWGGDDTIHAIRRLAPPPVRLIEWGHKLGFAYAAQEVDNTALYALSKSIAMSNGLLCSSCQGIYVNAHDIGDLEAFARRFLPIFEKACKDVPLRLNNTVQAQATLLRYNEKLRAQLAGDLFLEGEGCGVRVMRDHALMLSPPYRNIWIKALKKEDILAALHAYHGHLQTAAVLAGEKESPEIEALLLRAGVVQIVDPRQAFGGYSGMPHDGEYALNRYTKRVSTSIKTHNMECMLVGEQAHVL
ncbi:hypothetical protein LJC27_08450 [Christensenellaceae bacterium OttesenSCG-928-M15]|nr:hypothetical protein [Christensenellaceae bacterium OttesenSCG-928-M15]